MAAKKKVTIDEWKVAERVARGVALLDQVMPGWFTKIDLPRLRMAAIEHCILGQVYGHYHDGVRVLGLDNAAPPPGYPSSIPYFPWIGGPPADHGFTKYTLEKDYSDLGMAWLGIIKTRRGIA